jgi:HNH endonuclease
MEFNNAERFDMTDRELNRFHNSYKVDPITGCWVWFKLVDKDGYGRFNMWGKSRRAHRVSYEHFNMVKADNVLDHIVCDNKSCVNPSHLELSTIKDNTLRGNAPSAVNARRVTCDAGHEFDGEWYDKKGKRHRRCSKCQSQRTKAWRIKQRALGLPYS